MRPHPRITPWKILPVLIPFTWLLFTGVRGLDFGTHWDEVPYQIRPVKKMYESGTFLPDNYLYPSLSYVIGAVTVIPSFFQEKFTGVKGIKERVFQSLEGHNFLMRMRGVFLFITSLTVIWLYLTVLVSGGGWVSALVASSWLAFSWEVGYHARWVATDGILMQFAALTFLCCALWLKGNKKKNWLRGAAVTAGLACGTKYPGALVFLPVLMTAWYGRKKDESVVDFVRVAVKLSLIFLVTYFVTTPGTLIQPMQWLFWVNWIRDFYSRGYEWGTAIEPGFFHLWRMLVWLSAVAFSHYVWISLVATLLFLAGAVATTQDDRREERHLAYVQLAFMGIVLFYFSRQRIMNVRNILALLPPAAYFMGKGFFWIKKRLKKRPARLALAAGLVVCLAVNAGWQEYSAETIHARKSFRLPDAVADYVAAQTQKIYVSKKVAARLPPQKLRGLTNLVENPQNAELLVFSQHEMPRFETWPSNRYRQFAHYFPPYEINLEYYTTWSGDDHIVVMRAREFQKSRLPLTAFRN